MAHAFWHGFYAIPYIFKQIQTMRTSILFFCLIALGATAQKSSTISDPEAAALLKSSSQKYKAFPAITADFQLTMIRPKLKADEPDSKYTEVQNGKVLLKGKMFKVSIIGNEVYCNGKDIWTYIGKTNECQVNDYIESNEVFSPSKLFSLYETDYAFQVKEKKQMAGKKVTVIEMAPSNKKSSFFKLDVGIDDLTKEILEVKIYEKNGTRYIYKPLKVTSSELPDSSFIFDVKKFPKVKLVDLR
jgi:outer membrane lipoprotein carrier protein